MPPGVDDRMRIEWLLLISLLAALSPHHFVRALAAGQIAAIRSNCRSIETREEVYSLYHLPRIRPRSSLLRWEVRAR